MTYSAPDFADDVLQAFVSHGLVVNSDSCADNAEACTIALGRVMAALRSLRDAVTRYEDDPDLDAAKLVVDDVLFPKYQTIDAAPLNYADWQQEVANGDTRRGFDDWVAAKKEEEAGAENASAPAVPPVRVFIVVDGGIVQTVVASAPIAVHICDHDVEGRDLGDMEACAKALQEIAAGDWKGCNADAVGPRVPELEAQASLEFFENAMKTN